MSYILEALKKAQAERQLGNAPSIHAPALGYAAPAARAGRHPLILGAVAGAVVVGLAVALGAAFLPRQQAPAPQLASVPAQVAAPLPVPAAPAVAAAAPAPAGPAPVPSTPAQARKPETPARATPAPRAEPARAATETVRPVRAAATPAAAPAATQDAGDDVATLQSLPESVRREIPQVSFGGYIYSPNPADRLLLVDKMLRREGEEVAPGLVLERLLPKAAIMNYRGTRYRVGY